MWKGRTTSVFFLVNWSSDKHIGCKSVKQVYFLKLLVNYFRRKNQKCYVIYDEDAHYKTLVFFLYILFMQKGDTICMLAQAKIVSSNQTFMI